MEEQKKSPLMTSRQGSVSIAVFENTYGKSAVLQKSWKKAEETEWHRSSINLFMNELENLKAVVDDICEKAKEDIEASKKKE